MMSASGPDPIVEPAEVTLLFRGQDAVAGVVKSESADIAVPATAPAWRKRRREKPAEAMRTCTDIGSAAGGLET